MGLWFFATQIVYLANLFKIAAHPAYCCRGKNQWQPQPRFLSGRRPAQMNPAASLRSSLGILRSLTRTVLGVACRGGSYADVLAEISRKACGERG